MQEFWLLKLDWDEFLPHDLGYQWRKNRNDLQNISKITFPRYIYGTKQPKLNFMDFWTHRFGHLGV